MQAGDQVQRHVDAGGDAGGGQDAAVVDEPVRLHDRGVRRVLPQEVEAFVVSRGFQAVEQAGAAEQDRAGADGGHDLGGGVHR